MLKSPYDLLPFPVGQAVSRKVPRKEISDKSQKDTPGEVGWATAIKTGGKARDHRKADVVDSEIEIDSLGPKWGGRVHDSDSGH